jgi:hypothetical protein
MDEMEEMEEMECGSVCEREDPGRVARCAHDDRWVGL